MACRKMTLVVIAFSILVSACGVAAQSTPKTIDDKDVPFGLTQQTEQVGPSTTKGLETPQFAVFLVSTRGALVEVTRSRSSTPRAQDILDSLFDGPTGEESARGLRTAVPPRTRATISVKAATATVDLTGPFLAAGSGEQALAVAQMVFTVTGIPGVVQVRFLLDGEAVDIPRADGTLTRAPLSRDEVQIPQRA